MLAGNDNLMLNNRVTPFFVFHHIHVMTECAECTATIFQSATMHIAHSRLNLSRTNINMPSQTEWNATLKLIIDHSFGFCACHF